MHKLDVFHHAISIWLLGWLTSFSAVSSREIARCSHIPPTRSQVLPPVSLESEHTVRKRSVDSEWKNIRISIFYDDPSVNALSAKRQSLREWSYKIGALASREHYVVLECAARRTLWQLDQYAYILTMPKQGTIDCPARQSDILNHFLDNILPRAVKFWSDTLKVIQSQEPIRLHRKCKSNAAGEYKVHYPDPAHPEIFYCDKGCDPISYCGDVPIPDQHLLQCLYLAESTRRISFLGIDLGTAPAVKQVSGPPDGPGVADTDFVLYVSTLETERCNVSKTVAYAAHCQQEMTFDRPIAGHVNLCPRSLSDNPSDIESILSTVKHEILHALGFSVALFAFFRDPATMKPRTPRDKYGRPAWNSETNTYQWSPNTIKPVVRTGWEVRGGTVDRSMQMFVTPRVTQEVRKQFACDALEGAELENQGGEGTALTHWEKRIFENEAMTGVHTQDPVYSNITLALLEDSGWYRPDYRAANTLVFGHRLGCDFAQKSCKHWLARETKRSPSPYCDKSKSTANKLVKTECNVDSSSLSICNLSPFPQPLPKEYQNFDSIAGVPDDKLAYYGGSVDLADFCPYMQEFSWKSPTGIVRGSKCTQPENQPDEAMNFALEKYSSQSRCFFQDKAWSERTCQYTRTWQHWGSGCYEYRCANGRLELQVENRSLTCYAAGQTLALQILGNEWLHSGTVVCPSCSDVCEGNDDDFQCLPDSSLAKEELEKSTWDDLKCSGRRSGSSSGRRRNRIKDGIVPR